MTDHASPSSTAAAAPPPIVRAASVRQPPEVAFAVFTEEIGAWWPLPTHGIFGARSGGVAFVDDRLVEYATDGTSAVWGEVTAWEPPHRLVVSWHPGREASDGSEVEVTFEPDGDGTRVILEHRGWEHFGADALERRRGYVGPGAWGYVLDHFGDGVEPRLDAPDTTDVAAGYDALFAEFERGGFGAPDDGEWNAEEVLAHVALNDLAMVGVAQALVHGNEARFENQVCQEPDALVRWITDCGDAKELVERGRRVARQAMAAVRRLSAEQRATLVHCRMTHDGQVVLDDTRPWGVLAIDVQAGMHLPAHVEQLRALRDGAT
ncbi:MAG: SRPBCC domain-containing protein [Actinomycetota bacterium]